MAGQRVEPERRERYLELRRLGYSVSEASRRALVSRGWARALEQRLRATHNACPVCGQPAPGAA